MSASIYCWRSVCPENHEHYALRAELGPVPNPGAQADGPVGPLLSFER